MRVLIFDRYESIRQNVRLLIGSVNGVFVCGEAESEPEAISKAQRCKPDAIIMELEVPANRSAHFLSRMRELLPEIKIVVLSQYEDSAIVSEAFNSGANAYVAKTSMWNLTSVVRSLCAGPLMRREGDLELLLTESRLNIQALTSQIQLISDRIALPLARCSRDFRYLWVNEHHAKWHKRPIDRILGHRIVDVLGTHAFDRLAHHFDRVLAGNDVKYEEIVELKNIGKRRISVAYKPTLDSAKVPNGWVGLIEDITHDAST